MIEKTMVVFTVLAGMGGMILGGCARNADVAKPETMATVEAGQSLEDQEKMTEEQQAESMAEQEIQSMETIEQKVEEEEEAPAVKQEEKDME